MSPDQLPLTEDTPLRPVTPYAASKVAAEFVGLQAHLGFGVPVIRVRPFNHVGPGQVTSFVVSDLARRIALAARKGERTLAVGNLTPQRDFTDVRDVVRAYRLLVERGTPGEVYNVCSGQAIEVGALAARLLELAGADLEIVTRSGARPGRRHSRHARRQQPAQGGDRLDAGDPPRHHAQRRPRRSPRRDLASRRTGPLGGPVLRCCEAESYAAAVVLPLMRVRRFACACRAASRVWVTSSLACLGRRS